MMAKGRQLHCLVPCSGAARRKSDRHGRTGCAAAIEIWGLWVLRKAENVSITHRPGFWTRKGPIVVRIGKKSYEVGMMPAPEFSKRQEVQLQRPIALIRIGTRTHWQFRNEVYWDDEGLKSKEIYALIVTIEQRRRQYIERAEQTVAAGSRARADSVRQRIPEDVKHYIWTRDEGQCQNCGARTELQFDHIIPLAMNGSNNAENLQILCGPCNRRKSSGLTIRL